MSARISSVEAAGRIVAKKLAVGSADFFPAGDVGDEHPGAHDVLQVGADVV
jgi:hypothetical protein